MYRTSTHAAIACLRRSLIMLASAVLLIMVASPPAQGWTLNCNQLCNAATALQSYGTGPADTACLEACASGGSDCLDESREDLWQLYFACVDQGNPIESCRAAYGEAKECSVCDLGDVGTWSGDAFFVNQATCDPTPSYQAAGTYDDPLCKFEQGIAAAIDNQHKERDTKVIVCEGVYREGHDAITAQYVSAPGSAEVIVEAAVRGNAVVSGSDDWSGVWLSQQETVVETTHNELVRSNQMQHSIWQNGGVNVDPAWVTDPPTFAPQVLTKVYEVSATADAGVNDGLILQQEIPLLTDKLATFSVYIRPGAAARFMLDFRISNTETTHTGAYYAFDLPPGQPCADDVASGAAGFGIEDAGNDWYRVWMTQSVDTDPTTSQPLNGVKLARFHLVGPLLAGEGAEIFAPQLDHRPLDQFEPTPRDYLQTWAVPSHSTVSTTKALFTNNVNLEAWEHDWGLARHSPWWGELPPLMRRSEMIFVDDQLLRRELSITDMEPGSFFVDDGVVHGGYNYKHKNDWISGLCSASAPCPILIYPPAGVVLNEVKVEVAVRPKLLWLNDLHDWQLRGLHFQHATGAYDSTLMTVPIRSTPARWDCSTPAS